MSHLTKVNLKCSNRALLNRLAAKRGWTISQESEFVNPYSKERVENPTVCKDASGRVKLVLDQAGQPHIDTWGGSMGKEVLSFLTNYTTELVKQTAMMSGKMVVEKGLDAQGNLILEVAY